MVALLARLSRTVPLIIALAIIAIIAYFILQFRYSPPRAKSILIRVFTWITGIGSGFFVLACLYALVDGNIAVLDLFATFLGVMLVCLAIVRICHTVLVKHHPEFKYRAQKTTGTERFPWLRFWRKP